MTRIQPASLSAGIQFSDTKRILPKLPKLRQHRPLTIPLKYFLVTSSLVEVLDNRTEARALVQCIDSIVRLLYPLEIVRDVVVDRQLHGTRRHARMHVKRNM